MTYPSRAIGLALGFALLSSAVSASAQPVRPGNSTVALAAAVAAQPATTRVNGRLGGGAGAGTGLSTATVVLGTLGLVGVLAVAVAASSGNHNPRSPD